MPPTIVIGFVGGFIGHNNLAHSEVQLAARLRQAYPSGVEVETFESYRREKARKRVLGLLDTNHNGTLTPDEKQNARIIIYGHSWGGAEAIVLARELQSDSIAVLLTIQVDSISRIHQNDAVIPTNVAEAANFYQPHGFLHGQPGIHAADPTRTHISEIFASTTKRVLIPATRILGTSASSPGPTPRLNVIPECGNKWSHSSDQISSSQVTGNHCSRGDSHPRLPSRAGLDRVVVVRNGEAFASRMGSG